MLSPRLHPWLLGSLLTVGLGALIFQAGCRSEVTPATGPVFVLSAAKSATGPTAKLSFSEHIQPIMAEHCYHCHGPDAGTRQAKLRLDEAASATRDRGGYAAIVPFKPEESEMLTLIASTDATEMMPPPEAHKRLRPDEIAKLRQWIAEGAVYEGHWAFTAPTRPAVPPIENRKSDIGNPIDAFVRAKLVAAGLTPSPEADRPTLIRRVTYDLTGLPPTPAEVEAFIGDRAPGAYERVVDRLLASPRYGEHRTRYWLDYMRYADTHGIHFDNVRAIWPYRDYVIRAFNANKPFDRFVREQLAGDLLPGRTLDALIATGFVRSNLTTNEGGTVPEEVFINQTRDRVESFGATFLGLTTGCAACHDHKFDPTSQRDFYALAAYLGNTAERPWDYNIADPAPVLRLPKPEHAATAQVIFAQKTALLDLLTPRRARAVELTSAWLAAGQRPKPVSTDGLELRLKFDEGQGDIVKNSAPGAKTPLFKADTNPLVWTENSWLWPSMRMDLNTRIPLPNEGDVGADQAFSTGSWIMLRDKPGGTTARPTNGTLLARMSDPGFPGGGWEIAQNGLRITVSLLPELSETEAAALKPAPATPLPATAVAADAAAADTPAIRVAASASPVRTRGLKIAARPGAVARGEWVHLFVTYDGSGKAAGLTLYLNGKRADTEVELDALAPGDCIETTAAMHVGRRDDANPLRETRFQDLRFYRRLLTADEVARLPFEDVAAEILARQPDPAKWTTDERFVVADRFYLGEKDAETIALATAVAAHDATLATLSKDGQPTLIALEKPTPAYADILKRGDYFARGERVEPAPPHFLAPLPKGVPNNRLGLAEWLLAPEQPLLARVTVNRMWQEVFGQGIVESAGDFGITGDRPTHPELLDWLAVEFRESGWDVKKLYRLLVTSATYRQSAASPPERRAQDPGNKFLSRGPRFRMDAEMLRDSALATSGLLVEKIGGPPVKAYQPPGIWEEVAMPESNTKTYVQGKGDDLYRRSLYTFWKRASAPASLETFDATSREVVCTRRARTNTPLQAFVTMNDPQWLEAARKLAERAVKAAPNAAGRLDYMARHTLARPLAAQETAVLLRSAETFSERFAGRGDEVAALLKIGESPADPALAPLELAQWTMVASQFLNLDEFLTK
jgi:uncharacterized protein YkwD